MFYTTVNSQLNFLTNIFLFFVIFPVEFLIIYVLDLLRNMNYVMFLKYELCHVSQNYFVEFDFLPLFCCLLEVQNVHVKMQQYI